MKSMKQYICITFKCSVFSITTFASGKTRFHLDSDPLKSQITVTVHKNSDKISN